MGTAVLHAGSGEMTVAGWSVLGAHAATLLPDGTPPADQWVPSHFTATSVALGVERDRVDLSWIPLTEVVGLDQLGVDAEGLAILEFSLADGSLLHVRMPPGFVDELVGLLHRSRAGTPPAYEPPPAALEPTALQPTAPPAAPAPAATTARPAPVEPSPEPTLLSEDLDDPPPPPARSGTKAALAKEVAALRDYLDDLGFPQRKALRSDIETLVAHRTEVLAEVRAATVERRRESAALVRVRHEAVLQDVGIYRPRHPAEDSATRSARLEEVRAQIGEIVESGTAVTATDDWIVDGSRAEGRKVVLELAQLMVRTYHAEAELLVQTLRPYALDAAIDRLTVMPDSIHRLGASMRVEISEELHRLHLEELTLAADELAARHEASRVVTAAPASGAGYLYVVSNRGAFGPGIVRIGVTTQSDPEALVRELDGGALPFRSDVHALVPAADVAGLHVAVRRAFDQRRVNLADATCAFYEVAPVEVRDQLVSLGVTVPWFVVEAPAEEWHLSRNSRHGPE